MRQYAPTTTRARRFDAMRRALERRDVASLQAIRDTANVRERRQRHRGAYAVCQRLDDLMDSIDLVIDRRLTAPRFAPQPSKSGDWRRWVCLSPRAGRIALMGLYVTKEAIDTGGIFASANMTERVAAVIAALETQLDEQPGANQPRSADDAGKDGNHGHWLYPRGR